MQNQRRTQQPQRRTSSKPLQPNYNKNRSRQQAKKKKSLLPIVIALALLIILIVVICVACSSKEDKATQQLSNVVQQNASTTPLFPITVYDKNNVKLTITGYDANGILGSEINYTFENNAKVPIMFGVGDAYIDGWQITTLGGETLPAGTKTNGTIYLSDEEIEKCGITSFSSITLKECSIWNDESYEVIESFDVTLNLK